VLHTSEGDAFPVHRRNSATADILWKLVISVPICGRVGHENAMDQRRRPQIRRRPPFFKAPLRKTRTSPQGDENPLDQRTLHKKMLSKKALDKRISRKPRTDALRNRDRLLDAARTVFSAGGPDASLEAVARTAGVGIGTLYRHFPTREALFEAIYRHEVEQLADLAERLKRETRPIEALRQWMRSVVKFVATKKGMSAALALAIAKDSELVSYSSERLTRAIGVLLEQAVAAGEIRSDVSAEDLLRAIVGMCYSHDQPGWEKNVLRLMDIFVDGLGNRPGKS
jgi:AcrR family transcriptional regulator